ncbi:MAG: hypothetical protein R3321_09665, partial [Nitrososphaeraceae archaeon]|nr:hypothetical protein [Nitrososphaeraceae archaeon]
MDILAVAEENFVISFGISTGVGLLHGAILGRGIRNRFPSFKRHATAVSLILLILFSINAIANVIKFAVPEKIIVSELTMPSTPEEALGLLIGILGLDAGLWAVIVTFISISLILFFKLANIHKIARYFIFILSVFVLAVALISRFTDFV